jgi:hypothetical protein
MLLPYQLREPVFGEAAEVLGVLFYRRGCCPQLGRPEAPAVRADAFTFG